MRKSHGVDSELPRGPGSVKLVPLRAALASLLLVSAPAAGGEVPLFWLGRTKNANVVEYSAKVGADGEPDPRGPVEAHWLLRAEDGRREALNLFERLFAYGVRARRTEGGWEFGVVSLPARGLTLRRGPSGWEADTAIGGVPAHLRRIFVTTDDGAGTHVRSVELWGERISDGAPAYECLAP